MKLILIGLLGIISYIGITVSCIWAIIEFILYLVKDKSFDWWSVWSILICGATFVITFFLTVMFASVSQKEKKDLVDRARSKFKQRMEDTAKERMQ